jgi:tetratricopeptide (TPR) repeat protein
MAKPRKRPSSSLSNDKVPVAPQLQTGKAPVFTHKRFGVLIFLLGFLVYANTLGNGYAQDDAIVITDNMFTTKGIAGIPGILKYDTFYGFFKEPGKARLVSGGRYRPLSLVVFALEVEMFGQSPFVGHLVNVLLFAFCCWLFYTVVLSWLPERTESGLMAAFAAGVIFAVHPIHTEAVANIKGRDEILALLGGLGAMYFAFQAIRSGRYVFHIAGAVCIFLGLMAKENTITYLALIPLALFYFSKVRPGRLAGAIVPYFVAAGVFLAIRGAILGWTLGSPPLELMNNPYLKLVNNQYVPFEPAEKLATVVYTLGRYVQLLIFPNPLTHDYYPRHIDLMSWQDFRVLLSLFFYVGLVLYAVQGLRSKNVMSFAIWLYLIPLSIISNLVFPVGVHMAERLVFMPSVGFALAVGLLLFPLNRDTSRVPTWRWALLIILALAGTVRTVLRNPVWKDNFTLFSTDVKISQNSAKLQNAMAGELTVRSVGVLDSVRKTEMLRQAVDHARRAQVLHPTYTNAWLLEGNAHYYLKAYDASITAYRQALAINPEYREARQNLPLALRDAGRYAGEVKGDLQAAIAYLSEADAIQPDDYETLRLLGVAHGISGQHNQAITYFLRAANLRPEIADAWKNLSTAYFAVGDNLNGEKCLAKARELEKQAL